jgi:hypothetical protein
VTVVVCCQRGQFVKLCCSNRQSTFMPAMPPSSRLVSPPLALPWPGKLRIKQQIPNSRYTRGGLHGSFDNSNCPAAQHYLGLQGTYRPEGEAAHSLTPATTLSARMEPATVEAAGCSATLSLSPPPKASQSNPTCSRRPTPRPMLHWLPSPLDWSMAAICLLLGRTACTPAAGRG